MTRFVERRLKRTGNAVKSAVDRPWRRTLRGFTFTRRRPTRRQVSAQALKALTQEVRQRAGRTRGVSLQRVVNDLRQSLEGWYAYFRVTEGQSTFKDLDFWVWRRRYRELRKRGVSQDLAWNTCKSAHGPWRLSRSPALAIALPGQHFDRLGVPRL